MVRSWLFITRFISLKHTESVEVWSVKSDGTISFSAGDVELTTWTGRLNKEQLSLLSGLLDELQKVSNFLDSQHPAESGDIWTVEEFGYHSRTKFKTTFSSNDKYSSCIDLATFLEKVSLGLMDSCKNPKRSRMHVKHF